MAGVAAAARRATSVAAGSTSRHRGITDAQPRTHGSGRRQAFPAGPEVLEAQALTGPRHCCRRRSGGGCDPEGSCPWVGPFVHTVYRELTLAGWIGY